MSDAAATAAPFRRGAAGLKPLLILIGVAGAVAAGVSVALWSKGPTYSLLYANLSAEDQSQVTQALDSAGIPYHMELGSNGIEVPTEKLSEARLKLAGAGLPEGDGFATITKDPGLGVSQFMENARYQHALETELAHTIASLKPVDGARVHIAVPQESAFIRDQRNASASVFVQLKPGRQLSQEQVQAIINLVASSIPQLEANQVTVVDQQGRLLSSPQGSDEFALHEQHLQVVRSMEDDYTQRIEALLAPLVGAGHVRAQVVAQLDNSVTEEAHEQYKPDSQVVRSEQLSEQSSRDGAGSGGVPGALSNQPPPAGTAQAPAAASAPTTPAATAAATATAKPASPTAAPGTPAGAAAPAASVAAADNTSKQSTRNYEIDRTLAYTRQPSGRLKRLTVAVLLDNIHTLDKDGKAVDRPLSAQELAHATELIKGAVGFDESRGDVVSVVNSSFQTEAAPPETELQQVPIYERPAFLNLLKIVAGLVAVLVLLLTVLRPLIKELLTPTRLLLADSVESGGQAAAAEAPPAPPVPYDQQVSQARAMVTQDPRRVAQVVRTWVATDE